MPVTLNGLIKLFLSNVVVTYGTRCPTVLLKNNVPEQQAKVERTLHFEKDHSWKLQKSKDDLIDQITYEVILSFSHAGESGGSCSHEFSHKIGPEKVGSHKKLSAFDEFKFNEPRVSLSPSLSLKLCPRSHTFLSLLINHHSCFSRNTSHKKN